MKKMKSELNSLSVRPMLKNQKITGYFNLKNYDNIIVGFELANGEISFMHYSEEEKNNKSFNKWLLNEKDFYTTFILNYFNEITKINEINSFKGMIIGENSVAYSGVQRYVLKVQYEEIPNVMNFIFFPNDGRFELLYQIPIPINSEGGFGSNIYMEEILQKETIQRMWEPFRDKTKYRLQLIQMLR